MPRLESLQEVLPLLVAERRGLRERDADRGEPEANRLELARRQRELSHALIERHLHHAERDAARGQPRERLSKDMERDYFMTRKEACQYGIIDRVIAHH